MASKSYRKFMATGLSAAVVASVVAPVAGAAASYTDVKDTHWAKEAIDYVSEVGYMQGNGKGFAPDTNMTRAEAAQLFTNIFGIADESLTEDFSDVSEKDWFHDAVAAVLEHEIMNGMGNDKFAPNANLTRGQLAAIVVRAYGFEGAEGSEHSFSDIEGHMFEEEISILASLGLVNGVGGDKFAPDAHVTRAQMAQIIYNIDNPADFLPVVTAVEAVDTKTVEVTVEGSWTQEDVDALVEAGYELTVEGEESHKVGKVTVKAADASASEDTTTLVLSEISPELVEGEEFSLAVNGEIVEGSTFEVPVVTPKVASVSAINAKQVVVNFNKTLNSDSAVVGDASEAALYTLDGTPATSAVLSDDKKSVTLTFAGDVEGADQVLVVNPIVTNDKDENGAWVKTVKYSGIFSYTDSAKPVITSTSYANGKITLNFSEDLSALPTVVRVNGVPVTTFAFAAGSTSKVEVTTTLAAGTTASLYVAGALDDANTPNLMDLYNGSVVAPGTDTEKPRISSFVVTGQNTAKVTLSEAVTENPINATLQKGATQTPVTLVKDTTDTTGKTYTLTVDLNAGTAGDGIFSGTSTSETFTLYVAANAMTDVAGLKNDLYSTSLTFVKDTTAPSVTSSQVGTDNKKLEFTFSEALTVVGADSSIVITNGEGVRIAADATETVVKGSDNKTYQIDTKTGDVALDAGTYTVSIPAGFFTDAYGNASAAVTGTFTVGAPSSSDTVKPTATVGTTATNTFTVTYSEEVSSSGLSLANYKLDGQALPTGTDIYFTDSTKKVVVIALPTNTVNFGNQATGAAAVLSVSGVTDKAGNAINTSYYGVTVKDNTAATITNVQVIGQDVYVTFTENLTVPAVAADSVFDIKVNGVAVAATTNLAAVSGNAKQVKFTLDATPAGTPVVTVKAAQIALTDANGVAVK
ncbi:S-layer homology domain-containing protein [Fictibacillus halophilus]|uniref:S-layer homology domain-containing protein n=1 Tax=Fictibacillus halophilus TaxID=1610490 RepID=UPI00363218C0